MDVSGFTFIRNAVSLHYPVREAIKAVLPIVDEFVVNVGTMPGEADDGTLELIRSIGDPKIRIIQSLWNPHLADGGYVYAQQTNIALGNCVGQWAVYVQSDEVVHEADHDLLRDAMGRYRDDANVDGLTLWQHNFWGDYHTRFAVRPWVGRRKSWIVKPHHFVMSRGDAANFTVHPKFKERGRKLRVVQTAARQFHYSHVKSLPAMQAKQANNRRYWHDDQLDLDQITHDIYYTKYPRQFFERFAGDHPAVMRQRIDEHPVTLDHDSPDWRRALTPAERRLLRRHWLIEYTTDRFTGRGDYTLVGRHS